MSNQSALLGHTPNTQSDAWIRRAMVFIAPSQLNPNASQPFGPSRPADYRFESRGASLGVGEGFCIFFILLFTIVRLWTRLFRTRMFGLDDWMIIPGALSALVYLSLSIVSHTKGCLGKHIYDCTYDEIYWYMRTAHSQQWLFYFCVYSVKLSIALSNRRITGLSSEGWMRTHWIFIGLFVILLPLNVFLEAFQCTPAPVRYSLLFIGQMKDPRQIKCLDARAISLQGRALHIITDVALLCVPIIIVLRLQHITWRKKLRLTYIFTLGGMSTIASLLRNRIITRYLDDMTWQYYEIYIWNYIDITFAVVVASLPALNGLFDIGISKVKSFTSRHSSQNFVQRSTNHTNAQNNAVGHSSDKSPSTDSAHSSDTTSSEDIQMGRWPLADNTNDANFGAIVVPIPGRSLDEFLLRDVTSDISRTGNREILSQK